MVEYLAMYGIWGITGPVLAVLVPAIGYIIWRGV